MKTRSKYYNFINKNEKSYKYPQKQKKFYDQEGLTRLDILAVCAEVKRKKSKILRGSIVDLLT